MVTRSYSTVFGRKKKKDVLMVCFTHLAFPFSVVTTAFISSSMSLDSLYTSAQVSLGRRKSLYPQSSIPTTTTTTKW